MLLKIKTVKVIEVMGYFCKVSKKCTIFGDGGLLIFRSKKIGYHMRKFAQFSNKIPI